MNAEKPSPISGAQQLTPPFPPLAAIVLCAGQGTRMKSRLPKLIHPLLGRPLASYPIRRAIEVGAERVIAVTGHGADEVERVLTESLPEASGVLRFARQEKQLGTAHAVLSAKNALADFEGEILILNGDVPLVTNETLQSLIEAKRVSGAPIAFVTSRPADPARYGRIERDAEGRPARIIEFRDASESELQIGEVNAGLYLADSVFLWDALSRVNSDNAQHELYLTDLIALAYGTGKPAQAVEVSFDEVGGVNDRAELALTARLLQRRINLRHMKAGVTMENPETALIDESVSLAQDVTLAANVRLKGKTTIEEGVTIGEGAVIKDALIRRGAEILPYCVIESAIVGEECKVGPFARLRQGTELEERVHIGNFVETKKAAIHEGAKANHLSYLGDCDIGSGTNIGAGTITCNYDGQHKHKTTIGRDVFVGSDSQFVAPVTIGDGVLIGAGSTITKDIPAKSMAIARGRQKTFEGYMEGRRPGDKKN